MRKSSTEINEINKSEKKLLYHIQTLFGVTSPVTASKDVLDWQVGTVLELHVWSTNFTNSTTVPK